MKKRLPKLLYQTPVRRFHSILWKYCQKCHCEFKGKGWKKKIYVTSLKIPEIWLYGTYLGKDYVCSECFPEKETAEKFFENESEEKE